MIPTNLYGIVVMTRDGVPLFGPGREQHGGAD